ncbi:MAG: terpene cyclase/mutase family protein [Planctomycetota bacterium]|nr:terpene cyclase/mutase family protein [Planctomycetota bacterium]
MNKALADMGVAVGLLGAIGAVVAVDVWINPDGGASGVAADGQPRRGGLLSRSIYARRTAEDREEWIQDYGGSPISEQSVTNGLAWLARHQAQDGSWSNRCLGPHKESLCEEQDRCTLPGRAHSMALTGLPLLAFQAGGHYHFNEQKYSDVVTKGLDWLVEHQRKDGGLHGAEPGSHTSHYMYEHGIAAFALAEACALSHSFQRPIEGRYQQALEHAVQFILDNQHADGGWRYSPNKQSPSDTSISGWQVLALKTAKEAGVKIDNDVIEQIRYFFKKCETGRDGRTGYVAGGGLNTDATTGVGMLAHQFLLGTGDSKLVSDAAPFLAKLAETKWKSDRSVPDYYLWYNCTLAMFQASKAHKAEWSRWNDVIRERLIALQAGQEAGCERGSWAPKGSHDPEGGRIYATALAVLTLEVYYRFAQ